MANNGNTYIGIQSENSKGSISMCNSTKTSISTFQFILMILFDIAMYATLMFRNYDGKDLNLNLLIFHFYSFSLLTDFIGYIVPAERRHWFNVFRFFRNVQVLQTLQWLKFAELDGDPTMSSIRKTITTIGILHSGFLWYCHGPFGMSEYTSFLTYFANVFSESSYIKRFHYIFFLLGIVSIFAGENQYRTHYNYGYEAVDAPLISLSSGNGVTVFMKVTIPHLLANNVFNSTIVSFIIFASFATQFVLFFDMFVRAPTPYTHVFGEIFYFIDFSVFLYTYLSGDDKGQIENKFYDRRDLAADANELQSLNKR